MKDAHLVEVAWATDRRVASLDERVRGHLAALCPHLASLGELLWVNPATGAEQPCDWVRNGLPDDDTRSLGRWGR